jgi:hypothetical protein
MIIDGGHQCKLVMRKSGSAGPGACRQITVFAGFPQGVDFGGDRVRKKSYYVESLIS